MALAVSPTNPKAALNETPIKPIKAAGIGSKISATITPKNTAKKYCALTLKPSGVGIIAIIIATIIGNAILKV